MSQPEAPNSATPNGVIHDIGFRRYDGPRLGRSAIGRSMLRTTFASTFGIGRTGRSKAMPFILLGVMLLPALILEIVVIVANSIADSQLGDDPGGGGIDQGFTEQLLPYTGYALVTSAAIMLFLAVEAPQVFSRDLRYATTPLYFSRPLTRVDYVLAKYGGLAAGLLVLMTAPLLLMFIGGLLAGFPVGQELTGLLQAFGGVVVLSLMLAGVGGLIASIVVRRGFAIATTITVGMVSMALAGAISGIGEGMGNATVRQVGGLFSPVTLLDGVQHVLFDADPMMGTLSTRTGGLALAYLGVTVVLIVGTFALLLARYRKV